MSNILSRSLQATFPQAIEQRRVQSWNDSVQDQLWINPYGQTYAYQNRSADAFGNRNWRQRVVRFAGFDFGPAEERLLHCTPGIGDTNHNSKSDSDRVYREGTPRTDKHLQFRHEAAEGRQT